MLFDVGDALSGFLGGLLIGTAAALFLLVNGRIAGISGLLSSLLRPSPRFLESACMVIGVIVAPAIYAIVFAPPIIVMTDAVGLLIVGGLLVGVGTAVGNGCTSGHGICGLSRFSLRSLVATGTFMAVAILVVALNGGI